MLRAQQCQRGFTLIELVAVIVVSAILAAVAIPKFLDLQIEAKDAGARAVAGGISSWSAMNYAAFIANGETTTGVYPDPYAWPYTGLRQCANPNLSSNALSGAAITLANMTFSGTIPANSCQSGSVATCSVAHVDTMNYQNYSIVCATY
jgi:prepilin-type N-terminal cleavage/methylation domain-containing protein